MNTCRGSLGLPSLRLADAAGRCHSLAVQLEGAHVHCRGCGWPLFLVIDVGSQRNRCAVLRPAHAADRCCSLAVQITGVLRACAAGERFSHPAQLAGLAGECVPWHHRNYLVPLAVAACLRRG